MPVKHPTISCSLYIYIYIRLIQIVNTQCNLCDLDSLHVLKVGHLLYEDSATLDNATSTYMCSKWTV